MDRNSWTEDHAHPCERRDEAPRPLRRRKRLYEFVPREQQLESHPQRHEKSGLRRLDYCRNGGSVPVCSRSAILRHVRGDGPAHLRQALSHMLSRRELLGSAVSATVAGSFGSLHSQATESPALLLVPARSNVVAEESAHG